MLASIMARPIRIEFEDAVYHVVARGNERREIVRDEGDRRRFTETLAETVDRHGVLLHAYCLMPNHYHLLLQTPRANLSAAVGWLQTTYSIRFNRRHERSGHLYSGRFKAHLVDAAGYACRVVLYLHLNPVRPMDRSAPIPADQWPRLDAYPWSSHRSYAGLETPPSWLCLEYRDFFGGSPQGYRRELASAFGGPVESPWEDLRGGLVLGGDELWRRVRRELAGSPETEPRRRERLEAQDLRERVARLAAEQGDRRLAIWLRVRLGGEAMTALARDYGYRDGSGVLRVVQRLEAKAAGDPELARRMSAWRGEVSRVKV